MFLFQFIPFFFPVHSLTKAESSNQNQLALTILHSCKLQDTNRKQVGCYLGLEEGRRQEGCTTKGHAEALRDVSGCYLDCGNGFRSAHRSKRVTLYSLLHSRDTLESLEKFIFFSPQNILMQFYPASCVLCLTIIHQQLRYLHRF